MGKWLARIAAIFALVLVGLGIYAIVEPVALFGYDALALQRSLQAEAPAGYGDAKCKARGSEWQCDLETDKGSGKAAAYFLRADEDGCWTAKPVAAGNDAASAHPRLDGCVDLTDIIL